MTQENIRTIHKCGTVMATPTNEAKAKVMAFRNEFEHTKNNQTYTFTVSPQANDVPCYAGEQSNWQNFEEQSL